MQSSSIRNLRGLHESEASDIAYDMFNMDDSGNVNNFTGNHKFTRYLSQSKESTHESNASVSSKHRDHDADDEKINYGQTTTIFLVVLGAVAGIVNGCIILGNSGLAYAQALIIDSFTDYASGLFMFMTTTAIFVYLAACLCKYVSNRAAGRYYNV